MKTKVTSAHIYSGVDTYGKGYGATAETSSATSVRIRVPLTPHAKKRLGIPPDHKAFVMLTVAPPKEDKAINDIVTQLLDGDPIYIKKG